MKKLYLLSLTTVFLWMLSHLPVAAQPAPIMPGDINCDRVIDVSDVDVIIDNILGRQELEGKGFINADLTHDGIIDVADVNALIDLILGKGYAHADPRSLVVALRDGSVHMFSLADKPEVSFVDDEMLVKSDVETSYFNRNQLYQVYYNLNGLSAPRRTLLKEPVADNPNQYAVYIYRNDDDFNAHLNIDIESIRFSAVGMDSIWYDNAVVQEIWTPDSVYRTPLAVVDSLTFQAPDPQFKLDVFHISADHLQYVRTVDDLTIEFDSAIPNDMLPVKGQVVVSDVHNSPFDEGFAGRVKTLQRSSSKVLMTCEQVSLEDVYDQILSIGRTISYFEDESEAPAAKPRRISINKDGTLSVPLGKFSLKLKDPSLESSNMSIKLDVTPSIDLDYIVIYNVKGLENRFKVVLKPQLDLDMNYNVKFKLFGADSDSKCSFADSFIPIETTIPGVYAKIKWGVFFDYKGEVSLNGKLSYHSVLNVGWDSAKDSYHGFVFNNDGSGWGEPDVSLSLDGSVAAGPAFQFVACVVTEKWGFPTANITVMPGPELKGKFTINDDIFTGDGWSLYEGLKDSKVTLAGRLKIEGEAKVLGQKFELPSYEYSPDWLKKELYLFPEFTQPSLLALKKADSPTSLYSEVSRDLFLPVKVGMGVYDQSGDNGQEFFNDGVYWFESDPLHPSNSKKHWVSADMEQYASGGTYNVVPVIRTLFGTVKASPTATFIVPEPMSLETNQVTVQKGKAANVAINGGWGEFTIFNLNKDACTAELKKDGNAHYIQIVGKTEGTSSTVTVKDARTGDTKVILVSVSEQADKQTFTVNGVSFTMVNVKGGTFTMGATDEQGEDPDSDEFPPHQVTLSNYSIGETEVTQELWRAVMGSNPSNFNGDNLPVECVSWDDCQTFITKLNQLTGGNFRLPTEAEWEYAARGGEKTKNYKYAGSNTIGNVAWYKDNSNNETHPVGMKAPNELGLYDMCGNVWEWCQDWYGDYSDGAQTNPTGPSSGTLRVNRGGSFNRLAVYTRLSKRGNLYSDYYRKDLGLRLVSGPLQEEPINPETTNFTVNGVSFKMVAVEGGTFMMGATAEQGSDYLSRELPTHLVTLSSYSIGATEVTQELWQVVMGSNPSSFTGNLQRPVENVSWNDCQEFITKLNQMTGKNFRLPTEAEWEFAARGGNKSKGYKYSGSNTIDDVAWYYYNADNVGSSSPDFGTHSVATKYPNELGLYDMSGNVWEWCQDWYGSYSSDSQTNPTGPSSGSFRVNRGGSWDINAGDCRVSDRNYDTPGYRISLGLRLAL